MRQQAGRSSGRGRRRRSVFGGRRRGILPELHSSRSPGPRSGRLRRSPGGGARPGTGRRSRTESRSSFRSSFRSSLRSPFPVAVRSSEAPARRIPGNLRNPRKFPENSPERAAPRPGARPGSPPPSAPVVLPIGPGPGSLDRFPGRGREASPRPTLARGRAARIETPGPRGFAAPPGARYRFGNTPGKVDEIADTTEFRPAASPGREIGTGRSVPGDRSRATAPAALSEADETGATGAGTPADGTRRPPTGERAG